MQPTYEQFLQNELKLASVAKIPNAVTQRFIHLRAISQDKRDRIDQVEFEALEKVFRAKWRAQTADAKAKILLDKIEVINRRADTRAKILIGVAALQLARQDPKLGHDLLTLSSGMPSADRKILQRLLAHQTAAHTQREV